MPLKKLQRKRRSTDQEPQERQERSRLNKPNIFLGILVVLCCAFLYSESRWSNGRFTLVQFAPKVLILNANNETTRIKRKTSPQYPNIHRHNDNAKIPGLVLDDRLYILGLRLTTSHEKSDESVYLDMFGHAVGEGANAAGHLKIDKQPPEHPSQLSYTSASQEELYCRVEGTAATGYNENGVDTTIMSPFQRVEFIPSVSLDVNTVNLHLIWRCDVSSFLNRSQIVDRQSVRMSLWSPRPPPLGTDDSNSIYATLPQLNLDSTTKQIRSILTVDIPLDLASIGHAGPLLKSPHQPSFLRQVHNSMAPFSQKPGRGDRRPRPRPKNGTGAVTLCVGGISNMSFSILPEFVQHHINVGFTHIMLGFRSDDQMRQAAQRLDHFGDNHNNKDDNNNIDPVLSHHFHQGSLVLGCSHHSDAGNAETGKLRFYNQCLYHAKGISDYVMNLDLDELWMPPIVAGMNNNNQNPYNLTMSIRDAVQQVKGPDGSCREWCFQTFPSFVVQRVPGVQLKQHEQSKAETATNNNKNENDDDAEELIRWHAQWTKGYEGYTNRHAEDSESWKKPVIRTKYAFQASYHIGGSCHRRPDVDVKENPDPEKYKAHLDDCPFVKSQHDVSVGKLHHFVTLFRPEWGLGTLAEFPVHDEYTKYMRETTVRQIAEMRKLATKHQRNGR